jgi:hypothetical protein
MMVDSLFRISVILLFSSMLSACVVGQHIPLESTPQGTEVIGKGEVVTIEVHDQRESVTSGQKQPWSIGQYRAALGVPWEVTTEGNVPLAQQLNINLGQELISLGFTLGATGKKLQILIDEWDFTGYQNGRFWYELVVNILDSKGTLITTYSLGEEIPVKGTLVLGARGGFERDMPKIYDNIIASIVRNNPQAQDSLTN